MAGMTKALAAAALALLLSACEATPDGGTPVTLAEWREAEEASTRRPSWRHPPVNLTREGFRELLPGTAFVGHMGVPGKRLELKFYGKDGRYVWCAYDQEDGYFSSDQAWNVITDVRSNGATPLLDVRADAPERRIHQGTLYDGHTGEIMHFIPYQRRWWDWSRGHLQKRLPAATWTVCPDFPSAEELGVEVNLAQTALNYPELVVQDPGERILRPNLVTPNAVRRYE